MPGRFCLRLNRTMADEKHVPFTILCDSCEPNWNANRDANMQTAPDDGGGGGTPKNQCRHAIFFEHAEIKTRYFHIKLCRFFINPKEEEEKKQQK